MIQALNIRDPLFGIMAFLLLIALVAVVFIVLTKMKNDKQDRAVKAFLRHFPTKTDAQDYAQLLRAHPDSFELLFKVAKAYMHGGEFERALGICLALLAWISPFEKAKKVLILDTVGDIYTKSGFMVRSVQTYEKSLSLSPRNISTLTKLLGLYIKKKEYAKAIEVCGALDEMNALSDAVRIFVEGMHQLESCEDTSKRLEILECFASKSSFFAREYLKTVLYADADKAVSFLQHHDTRLYLDILWETLLPSRFHTSNDAVILGVLDAKNEVSSSASSGIFELDALRSITKSEFGIHGRLEFSYVCSHCGHVDIGYFPLCEQCGDIESCYVKIDLKEQSHEMVSELSEW